MTSGDLTDLIDIEELVITGTGDRGEPIASWTTLYAAVPADVKVLSGRKLVLAKELTATAQYEVSFRWLANISVKNRIHVYLRARLPVPTVSLYLYVGHVNDNADLVLTCSTIEK